MLMIMKHVTALVLQGLLMMVFLHQIAFAQVVITGTVTDLDTQDPIPGATVLVQGTTTGTASDNDGNFTLEIPSYDSVIRISFIGYSTQLFNLQEGETEIHCRLRESVLGLEELIVVGTRREPRLVKDSAVPVDVLGPRALHSQASADFDDVLRTQVPSFNVQRHGIDDEGTLVRPITLRGLPADNVVVLLNGKRRHRSASIALLGSSLNAGAQGADLNMIPSIAIDQLEILRDGASAQYGADAVAGVMNMQLRNNTRGVLIRMRGGQYLQHGDGEYGQAAVNVGLPLGSNGFVNLSLEWKDAAPTIRSGTRRDAALLVPRGYPVSEPAQIWGSPDIDNSYVGFANLGLDLSENLHLYAFGGFGQRTAEGGFYFRSPGTSSARSSVFRFGSERAVGDLDLEDDVDCAHHPDLPSLDSDKAAVDAFIAMTAGDCFLFNEKFPGGFTPRFGADISDWSVFAGIRGGQPDGLTWDASFSMAHSIADYFIYNTVNASYGLDTPTSFRPRDYVQDEMAVSLQLGLPVEVSYFSSPLNVAFGAEYRNETFASVAGDEASWSVGPYATQGFSVGSNGYQGLNPEHAGEWSRPNVGGFVDLEADVSDDWVVGIAARYENFFDNFGSTLTGKVAALYRATDRISFRGTVSTGFRAPTPGQSNLQIFQTALSAGGDQLVETAQLPPTHPVAAGLGGKELTEETARSLSLGTVVELAEDLTLTFDYFNISIQDRISLTGNISVTPEIQEIMNERKDELGGQQNLAEVKYFSNDFDTNTRGTDLLLAFDRQHDNDHATTATLAWNWTRHSLSNFSPPTAVSQFLDVQLGSPFTVSILTPRRQLEIEHLNPSHRFVAYGRHLLGSLWGALRVNYWGSWESCINNSNACEDDTGSLLHKFSSTFLIDAEVGVIFADSYRFAIGADNIFNYYVRAVELETLSQGNARPTSTPWDYNGTHFYARFTADLF